MQLLRLIALAAATACALCAPARGAATRGSLVAAAAAATAAQRRLPLPLDCSGAIKVAGYGFDFKVLKFPSSFWSWARKGAARHLYYSTCRYGAPAPAGGFVVASDEDGEVTALQGPPIPSVQVMVLLNYAASASGGEVYKGGFVVVSAVAPDARAAPTTLKLRGYRLRDKAQDPVGRRNVLADGRLSTLKLRFTDDAPEKALLGVQTVRNYADGVGTPTVVFMCTGNTGRSPMAEQLARQTLEDDGMATRARVYSRARALGSSTAIEQPVVAAAVRKGFANEIIQGLRAHVAAQFNELELINAHVILTVDQTAKTAVIKALKKIYEQRSVQIRSIVPTYVQPPVANVFTISEFVGGKYDIADPYNVEHNKQATQAEKDKAFDKMVRVRCCRKNARIPQLA